MANVDPLVAHRPEFADTQPDLSALACAPTKTTLARIRDNATPLLIGAGVGAGVVLLVIGLSPRRPAKLALFPERPATLIGGVAKIAIIAVGRIVLRRAFAHVVEAASTAAL